MKQRRGLTIGLVAAACLGRGEAIAQGPAESEVSSSASNITAYQPEFFAQFRPNTALDMVTRVPGFTFRDSGGGRGFSGTAGNVLIDGERPPSRSDSLGSVVSRIPAAGVERIDIIRGGADGIDMQGLPIIANIIRKPDTGVTGAVSTNLNFNDAGDVSPNATLQLRNQSGEQVLEGSITVGRGEGSSENPFVRRDLANAVLRQGASRSTSHTERVAATGSWEAPFMGGRLRLNGLANASRHGSGSTTALFVPGGAQTRATDEESHGGEAGARYSRVLAGDYALELVAFQSISSNEMQSAFSSADIAGQADYTTSTLRDTQAGESILRASLQSPAYGEWSFEGGGEAVFNFSERDNALSYNDAPFELGGDRNRVEELRTDAFAAATWQLSPQLNIEMGSRFEWSRIVADSNAGASEKSLTYVKPRVNVAWTPDDGEQWGLRVERKVDQLDFGSFASSAAFDEQIFGVGNPEVEPEKIWEGELRYERQFGGQNSFVASYTHRLVQDVLGRAILFVPGTPTSPGGEFEITRNGGDSTIDRLTLTNTLELDAWGMPGGILSLDGSLQETEMVDPVTGEIRERSGSNPWSWNASLQQTIGDGDFRWNVFVQDQSSDQSWSPHYINTYQSGTFVGGSVTWKPWTGWTFSASANNLLAEDSTNESEFYEAARTIGATPTYIEDNANRARRSFSLSVRKNF